MPFDIDELTWRSRSYKGEERDLSESLEVTTDERVPRDRGGGPDLRVQLAFNDGITKHNWSEHQRIEVMFGLAEYEGMVEAQARTEKMGSPEHPPGFAYVTLAFGVTPEVFTSDKYPEVLTKTS